VKNLRNFTKIIKYFLQNYWIYVFSLRSPRANCGAGIHLCLKGQSVLPEKINDYRLNYQKAGFQSTRSRYSPIARVSTEPFGSEPQVVQTPSGLSLFELVETEPLGDECPEGSSEPERPRDEHLRRLRFKEIV